MNSNPMGGYTAQTTRSRKGKSYGNPRKVMHIYSHVIDKRIVVEMTKIISRKMWSIAIKCAGAQVNSAIIP
jgi:hypothetical protein